MKGLPWIRLDTDVKEHPKSDRLADALGEPRAWTYMVELWLWVANNQPDGNLSDVPDSGIARRAGYEGDARRFVRAMTAAGFLGPDRVLSGWQERQAAIVAKFVRDRKKPDGRKSAKSGQSPEIPRGIDEGYERDEGGIHDAPAPIPHGDVDVDVDDQEQVPTSGKPDRVLFGNVPAKQPPDVERVWSRFALLAPKSRLNPARFALIRKWLKVYSADDLIRCIDGYAKSPHHNGENDRGTKYLTIELFLRDAKHIEQGWTYLEAGPPVVAKPTVPDVARPVQTTYVAPPAPSPASIAQGLAFIRANNPFKDAP